MTKYCQDLQLSETVHMPARTMTDAHCLCFAGMTGDNRSMHYGDEYAKTIRFGKRVVHG